MNITIGKIVTSNAHTDYVCQIYGPGEIDPLPEAPDYAYGTFAAIDLADAGQANAVLVVVIYNTLLVNPDYGNLGPRLSPREETEIFTPDYLSETATLVGIAALGWLDGAGVARQGVPPLAATNCPALPFAEFVWPSTPMVAPFLASAQPCTPVPLVELAVIYRYSRRNIRGART